MMACLKVEGKTLSDSDKFTMLVMGRSSESRQDFKRKVGMTSRAQVALEDCITAARTSSNVAGEKFDKVGGGGTGVGSSMGLDVGGKVADNLAILPLKNSRNDEASVEVSEANGRILGEVRERRE